MTKATQKLSLQEALAAGFKMAVEDGEDHAFSLTKLNAADLESYKQQQPKTCYWLLDIEPRYFVTSGDEIRELMGEVAINQDELGDEDGELGDLVDELYQERPELFETLAEALNEKWKKKKFYMPSDTQIDFTL